MRNVLPGSFELFYSGVANAILAESTNTPLFIDIFINFDKGSAIMCTHIFNIFAGILSQPCADFILSFRIVLYISVSGQGGI